MTHTHVYRPAMRSPRVLNTLIYLKDVGGKVGRKSFGAWLDAQIKSAVKRVFLARRDSDEEDE